MRSAKRYTTQTFTHRVDHEGGAHRGPKNIPEPAYCKKCGAEHSGRRWAVAKRAIDPKAQLVVCPACQQIANGIVGGYVTLLGQFPNEERDAIDKLVTNEATRAAENDPMSRLMGKFESEGKIIYHTTTEHLAQRIGRALEKAFGGSAEYDFSHENKVARVTWKR